MFPTSDRAGSNPAAPPLGTRLRLEASVDISGYPAYMQRLFTAMKTYGLNVADNGTDMYVSGTHDPLWEPHLSAIRQHTRTIRATDFEVVQLGWQPPATPPSDVPVVADRLVGWGAGGYGSHGERGLAMPSTSWYFAEGATHSGFQLFYLLQNPGDLPSDVTITLLRPSPLPPLVRTRTVAPGVRETIWVNYEEVDASTPAGGSDSSAVITATRPIVAERAMYTSGSRAFEAGHGAAGVTAPATDWFFAEGATGAWFDMFLLLANPTQDDAAVTVTCLLPDGPAIPQTWTVRASSRETIWVDQQQVLDGESCFMLHASCFMVCSLKPVARRPSPVA